jgi:hypothetical protein
VSVAHRATLIGIGINFRVWSLAQRIEPFGDKPLKKSITIFALALCIGLTGIQAATPAQCDNIDQVADQLGRAFEDREMGRLDPSRPYVESVTIVYEHSLSDGRPRTRSFRSLGLAEKWLQSMEHGVAEEMGPRRHLMPLKRCRAGVCTYDFEGGILHNQLYIKKFTYGVRRGKPYIKAIYLLDGD